MLLNPLKFHSPEKLSDVIGLYGSLQNVRLMAGGTFLLNSLKLLKRNGAKTPEHVISLRKVKDLKGLNLDKDCLMIRSMTTITEIFESPLLTDNFSVLKTVCRNISTTPIRNMATIGGNLTCRYTWTEMPAVMIALNANMHFIDKEGKEQMIGAEDFFKNAAKTDKILTHISIKKDNKASIAYQRIKKTSYVDTPLLSLCINTQIKGHQFLETRVAINNCVTFAVRDLVLENFLKQTQISKTIGHEALDHLDKTIYDTRSNDYKKYMFRVCLKNAITELADKIKK